MDARTFQNKATRTPAPAQFVRDAWDAGAEIDLTGVGYGRSTWDDSGEIFTTPESYYRFLAGAAYLTRAKSAVEVGTYWGGSTVSLARGMLKHSSDIALVTVDITANSDNFIPAQPETRVIKKIVGDSTSLDTIKQVMEIFDRIDLLYIDADHGLMPTLLNLSLYATLLHPKLVLIDDIRLTDEMKAFWEIARKAYPDHSVDCLEVIPDIRWDDHGFGLILMP